MIRPTLVALAVLIAIPAAADPLPVCKGGNREERRLTCIVDGDTGYERGLNWRMEAVDTPEMPAHAECDREADLAVQARDRLRSLMGAGYQIIDSGDVGRYGRAIVRVRLADGRDAGEVLISEGLAQPWPNEGNVWCKW
ncbi:thermonuclease family protein [Jiella marina]|uniref:thermonuclease family protein n=1 Tax=Jiella sp. LLJ827 TaxID=2917712 RepID=UPI002100B20D|nr:thermonuclease family protein [Jiella sp. LLJ827]MCQ0987565.1 thermonuclease family protein [Jiella sp. LLJ827]